MIKNGICEFCGQTNLTNDCDCPEAKAEKKKRETLAEAKKDNKAVVC